MANHQGVDVLCASFGSTQNTQNFWLQNGFMPIAQGAAPNKATGEISLFVMKQLTPNQNCNVKQIHLCYLADNMNISTLDLDALKLPPLNDEYVIKVYHRRILDYVNETRSYMHLGNAISVWLLQHERALNKLQELTADVSLLKTKWLESATDLELQNQWRLNGQKKLYRELQSAFQRCYWSQV